MQLGPYRVELIVHGTFMLDGGAMFGSVPKPLWSRLIAPDELNRIPMVARSLIIEAGDRRILVDTGCGDKWDAKSRKIFAFDSYAPELGEITDVVLSHLHFDHAGGVSRYDGDRLVPSFPEARHHVSRANLENARNPNVRERASYLKENLDPLREVDLRLTEDGGEIVPGITVHQVHGHTRGLQWLKLETDEGVIAFPSDLFPTSHHLPIPYVMGYDICAATAMEEKQSFIEQAVKQDWLVVFQHDPQVPAAAVAFDDRNRPIVVGLRDRL